MPDPKKFGELFSGESLGVAGRKYDQRMPPGIGSLSNSVSKFAQ
jgi:hypothetical protein